jgi:hypothetical protein
VDTWSPWQGGQSEVPADRSASQPIKEQRAWRWSTMRRCCQARATLIRGGTAGGRGRIGRRGAMWSLLVLKSKETTNQNELIVIAGENPLLIGWLLLTGGVLYFFRSFE